MVMQVTRRALVTGLLLMVGSNFVHGQTARQASQVIARERCTGDILGDQCGHPKKIAVVPCEQVGTADTARGDDHGGLTLYTITHHVYDPTTPALTLVQPAESDTKPTVVVPNDVVQVSSTERYKCVGWTAGGPQIPAEGGTTNYTFSNEINVNNSLTWKWWHEWAVDGVVTGGAGDILAIKDSFNNPGDNRNWYAHGTSLPIMAVSHPYHFFVRWASIPTTGIIPVGMESNPSISVTVNQAISIVAEFRPIECDTDGDGMPDIWELYMNFDPYDDTGLNGATGDPDADGWPNLDEFIADTDPRNETSYLAFTDFKHTIQGAYFHWMGGLNAIQYIDCTPCLAAATGQWTTIYTNHPPTWQNEWVFPAGATNAPMFYRIRAQRP